MYIATLNRLAPRDRERSLTALKWLHCSQPHSVSLNELLIVTAINQEPFNPEDEIDRFRFDPENMLDNTEMLLELLYPFVKVGHGEVVAFAHFSVFEFLGTEKLSNGDDNPYHLNTPKSHGELLRCCLTFMNSFLPETDDSATEVATEWSTESLMNYAAAHWPYHARLADAIPHYHDLIIDFLDWHRPFSAYRQWESLFVDRISACKQVPANMRTSLYYAAMFGLENVVETLLKHAAYECKTIRGYALLAASMGYWYKITTRLLETEVDVESTTSGGWTALCYAAENDDFVTADALLENNASALARTNTGWEALHFAADSGSLAVAEQLMGYGANPTRRSGVLGYSPLHLAARNGDTQLVACMLERLGLIGLAWGISHAQVRHVGTSIPSPHVSASSSANPLSVEEESIAVDDLAHTMLLTRRPFDVLDMYMVLLAKFPSDHSFYTLAGNAYFARQLYDEADEFYREGLHLDPTNHDATDIENYFQGAICSNCGDTTSPQAVRIKGYRYRCTVCRDVDLCGTCMDVKPFPHEHTSTEFKCIPNAGVGRRTFID